MNELPSKQVIEEVATELGTNEFFIEKDWYVVQALAALANIKDPKFTLYFAGGTSLSKGYKLIKRFSEDLDFRVAYKDKCEKTGNFKKTIFENLKSLPWVYEILKKKDGSKHYALDIIYSKNFPATSGARPEIKIEMTFVNLETEPESRPISSYISELSLQPEETNFSCVHPVETAADKLSAISWRLLDGYKYKPTDMRHLHDLCALKNSVITHPNLIKCYKLTREEDIRKKRFSRDETITDSLINTLVKLKSEFKYYRDYKGFVDNMAFGRDDDKISFEEALIAFEEYCQVIK
jgi:predicted nucleotidyltransferase component of viral defense system